MTTIGAFEAKTHLPRLLDRVAQGEEIVITRHGKPVALLTAPPVAEHDVKKVVKEMLACRDRQKRTTGGMTFREMICVGRRC